MKKIALFLFLSILLINSCFAATPLTLYVREETVLVDQAKLYCRIVGQGTPIIVIHGGPGLSQDYLLPKMAKLGKNHQMIFYDQRACGKSTGDVIPMYINLKTFVADIEAIRVHYNLPKVAILGHSWGAFLAMQYAIAHPGRVEKLVLMNSTGPSAEDFSLFVAEWQKRMEPFKDDLKIITSSKDFEEGTPESFRKYYLVQFKNYCVNPDRANELNLTFTRDAGIGGMKVNDMFKKQLFMTKFNFYPELKKLQVPTLIVHGDSDVIPVSIAENIHKAIPGSKLVIIEKSGHFPYVEEPETFFKEVGDFLKG